MWNVSVVVASLAWIPWQYHDDVIKWKHFPRYWPFVRGIHRSTGEFPAQRPVTRSFNVFFDRRLNKRLSKQSRGWWFETLSCSLWRHSNVPVWCHWLFNSCSVLSVCSEWLVKWLVNAYIKHLQMSSTYIYNEPCHWKNTIIPEQTFSFEWKFVAEVNRLYVIEKATFACLCMCVWTYHSAC